MSYSYRDPLDRYRLDEKIAVVTGGAGLLGSEFCQTLSAAGARVILADINRELGERISSGFEQAGLEVEYFPLDVTSADSIEALMQRIDRTYGGLDILVNSAAMDPKFDPQQAEKQIYDFESFPLDSWQNALDVNMTGMFLVTQAVSRLMIRKKMGSIINICSTYGLVGPDQRIYEKPGESQRYKPVYYSVTKAGVLGFTRYLASYYAGTEIRVNALTPGGVFNNHDDDFVKAYSARTILGRMARKDEMNGALLFLASDASSYMTGANLIVDGGWTAW
jgi:NAD(P)-dependent dehydrogenase (short-subunit alcohol dehydrogenase family)